MGVCEHGGKVRTSVIPNRKKKTLHAEVRKHVEAGSALYTDFLLSIRRAGIGVCASGLDHAVEYVDGRVHTNGLENFWSLLKRSISGTYVSVEPFHLRGYLDEQTYRFDNRKMTDGERFSMAVADVVGKRVTFDELSGKTEEPA